MLLLSDLDETKLFKGIHIQSLEGTSGFISDVKRASKLDVLFLSNHGIKLNDVIVECTFQDSRVIIKPQKDYNDIKVL